MSKSPVFSSSKSSISVIHTPLKIPQSEPKNRPKYVSLILTESIASSLNIRTHHLQDVKENASKSKICVLVGSTHSAEKKRELAADGSRLPVSDNVALFRVVPMEESSTSVYAMDDLSLTSSSAQDKQSNDQQFYLGPQCVNTNSLMAVCSLAHDGNLVAEVDRIFVNVRNNGLPLSSSGWVNMCRICHGSDSYEELIGPCRCKGSVALAHLSCLERWLKESSRSNCELCLHHYEIQREPKYGILRSILVWMSTPGEHRQAIVQDIISFSLYSPAAIFSTYLLMVVGETAARNYGPDSYSGHIIVFSAIAGIAAIDFTYSTWLMMRIQQHLQSWKTWYRENCCLTLLLPPRKRRRRCAPQQVQVPTSNQIEAVTEVD